MNAQPCISIKISDAIGLLFVQYVYPKLNKLVVANIITAIIRIALLCNHKSVMINREETNNCKIKTPRNIPEIYSDSGIALK